MAIETLDDIVESIMDRIGIYGAHDHDRDDSGDPCRCRCCESSSLRSRIIDAIEVERKLARQDTKESPVNAPQQTETAIKPCTNVNCTRNGIRVEANCANELLLGKDHSLCVNYRA